ncbi:MAG: hypothetical protein ACE5GW_10000 [Planctomycetota bacterium]
MRALLLLALLALGGGAIAFSIIAIPGGGTQFARQLQRHWELGRLAGEDARTIDLHTVEFGHLRLLLKGAGGIEGREILSLEKARWRRADLLQRPGSLGLAGAEIRFEGGELRLARREGLGWGLPGLGGEDPAPWWRAVPGSIAGRELRVSLESSPDRGAGALEFLAADPSLSHQAGGVLLACLLRGGPWGNGRLSWSLAAGAREGERGEADETPSRELFIRIDDADLRRFPFEALRGLFAFPWPVSLTVAEGRGDLVWRQDSERVRVVLDHYHATLPVSGLPHPLKFLTGRVTLTSGAVTWELERGIYSHSPLKGEVEANLLSRTLEGRLVLEEVISDRDIGRGLPAFWEGLLEALPLSGGSRLTVTLGGSLGGSAWSRVKALELSLRRAALSGSERLDALVGDFTITHTAGEWKVEGTTEISDLRGLRLPPSRWTGRVWAGGLVLERSGDEGATIRVRVNGTPGGTVGFWIVIEDAPMSPLLGRPLAEGSLTLHITGTWHKHKGVRWETRAGWRGVVLGPSCPWPGRRPVGALRGELVMERRHGTDRVERFVVRDDLGVWEATRGEVQRNGAWSLEGSYRAEPGPDGAEPLPPGGTTSPVAPGTPFHWEGRLLEWREAAPAGEGG